MELVVLETQMLVMAAMDFIIGGQLSIRSSRHNLKIYTPKSSCH